MSFPSHAAKAGGIELRKTFHVALREFKATVLTKGFIIGVLIMPVIMGGGFPLIFLLMNEKPPPVKGVVAVINRTGDPGVVEAIRAKLDRETIAQRLSDEAREGVEAAAQALESSKMGKQAGAVRSAGGMAAQSIADSTPDISVVELSPLDNIEAQLAEEQEPLRRGTVYDGSRLVLVVVDPDAVLRPEGAERFGAFQTYIKPKLDVRAQSLIRGQLRDALLEARLKANREDPARIRALTSIAPPAAVEVTATGQRTASPMRQIFIPMSFVMLIFISSFSTANILLTSTVEEKSNRVMEVLLSAVSPLELMAGKLFGQLAAGFLILGIYAGLGLSALAVFGMGDLVEPLTLVYLVIFFFIAYFLNASMMAAIGSAVNELREAQTLMQPVMIFAIAPLVLMMPIIFNPKGMLATILSLVPPTSPFAMVIRLSSTDPPPTWQVLLSIAIGVAACIAMVKVCAKIFRVGALMYGKPPNLATLIRWVRMA